LKLKAVCRKQHENLEVAFAKACDYGLLDHYVPHRSYDYSKYYPELKRQDENEKPSVLLGTKLVFINLWTKTKKIILKYNFSF
jgi:hypothetical protein